MPQILPDASLKHNRFHLSLPTNLGSSILCSVSKSFKISFHCTSCVSFTWSSYTLLSSHSSCKSSFAGSVTGVNSPSEWNTSAVDLRIRLFVVWFSCLTFFQMWIMSLWKFHINPSTLIEFPDARSPFGAVFITSVDFDAHSWRFKGSLIDLLRNMMEVDGLLWSSFFIDQDVHVQFLW